MQGVFDFILSHLEAIISFLTLVVSVIVFILRKKPVIDIIEYIYTFVPKCINAAEKTDLKGEDKLYYCLRQVIQCVEEFTGVKCTSYHVKYIKEVIETFLSTPQKKED